MSQPTFVGEQIWCPRCNKYTKFVKSAHAARLAGVTRRTIYRYIEEELVYAIKVAGKLYRLCSSCLLKQPQR